MNFVLFIYFFSSPCVSDFRVVFRKLMIDLGALFGFYSGNCFDWVVILFNSRTCVHECLLGVNCPLYIYIYP